MTPVRVVGPTVIQASSAPPVAGSEGRTRAKARPQPPLTASRTVGGTGVAAVEAATSTLLRRPSSQESA